MPQHTRRQFLKSAGAAALAPAVGGAGGADAAYTAAILNEPGLIAFWRLDGDLLPARGSAAGVMRNGQAQFASGPLDARALTLENGRFADFGPTLELDTDTATVEFFFQVLAPPPGAYNPCLIAKRASSSETRWSLHYRGDLAAIDVWNGDVLGEGAAAAPIRTGEWHHLAVAFDRMNVAVYLDGSELDRSGGDAVIVPARRGLPLRIGASSEAGDEAVTCRIADVAIYGAALATDRIARHLQAVDWANRRRADDERARLDRARMDRDREKALKRRQNDPRLMAPGAPRDYAGEHLTAISFPVGGIGAGTIQMNGKAERAIWQIFNNFDGGVVPNSFLALRCARTHGSAAVRALQTSRMGPIAGMKALTFRGEYPFGWYTFQDEALPVSVELEVFSPLIPLREQESAIPCALFNVTVRNRADAPVDVTVAAVQQNAVGYRGDGVILDRRFKGYGGNRSAIQRQPGATVLHLTADRSREDPAFGDMAVISFDGHAVGTASLEGMSALPDAMLQDGPPSAGPSPRGETLDGLLASGAGLAPGESRTFRFALVWYFPNSNNGGEIPGWEHHGNRYAVWWGGAQDVADYLIANAEELARQTRLYHDTFYAGNLPYWLRDRITSQVAILRSKTCFWAADDYFGAWEGCAPGSGCCAGNCTHVWHYAQAHARLFPSLARRMREETFSYQRPDGAIPHRHPSYDPAADGLLGDVIGVYREHLCSADGAWLHALWPRAQRAMEYAIRTWDPDENGLLHGAQWNTLDGALGGSTTWIGSLYLTALAACERMADLEGDNSAAARYRRIREIGAQQQNDALWNGEYYIQRRDPQPHSDYGDGCEIDQLLGEWWARQVGLPEHYPGDRVRGALTALVKYNFRADFRGLIQAPRKFVDDGDAGMQMIQWPHHDRPKPTILYGDEVMTGFEYAAAATMVQNDLLRDGFMMALAISDRYDGRLRTGLTPAAYASWGYSGNPFGDDECGKFYARAMSVWSLLLAAQGFLYDGPAARIGFRPVWRPNDHASFFTSAEGWGLYTQRRRGIKQTSEIALRWGTLRLRTIELASGTVTAVRVTVGGQAISARHTSANGTLVIQLEQDLVLEAPQTLHVMLSV